MTTRIRACVGRARALRPEASSPNDLPPVTDHPSLAEFSRVVVKVGSSLLVDRARGALKQEWLDALVADIAALHERGADVLVVSSGAIALGRTIAGLPKGVLKLEDSQAAAAIGQIALARAWSQALHGHGIVAGQVLLTLYDTEERRRYLNARETLGRLSAMRAIPVINENDTVATSEIRYGDNDRLAARVATMASADLLVLLSDVAGLYDAPPKDDPKAKLIPVVERVTPAIEAMAGGAASELSRGGMRTKIEAARIATSAGTHMVIADGRVAHPIARIAAGAPCTWFLTPSNPLPRAQGVDRRLAGAEGLDHGRRRRREGAGERQEPVAGGRDAHRGRLRARRLRRDPRRARRRTRPRPDRLRRPARRTHPRPQFPRHRPYSGDAGPRGDDPSRRYGAGGKVRGRESAVFRHDRACPGHPRRAASGQSEGIPAA